MAQCVVYSINLVVKKAPAALVIGGVLHARKGHKSQHAQIAKTVVINLTIHGVENSVA